MMDLEAHILIHHFGTHLGIKGLEMKDKTNISVLFIPILIGILVISLFWYMYIGRYGDDWKERTTPLPQSTIATLCENFNLNQDHKLCSGKKVVYGPDFNEIIRTTFQPRVATFNDVDEKIGMFKQECYPVVHQDDGFSYFRCRYDLRGDEEFIIGIIFTYPDNAVFRIMTPMGYDGE